MTLKEKIKNYVYQITHDYDVRAMFFVFNSLMIDIGFLITYIVLMICNRPFSFWYGELALYYIFLIIGYRFMLFKYLKFKDLETKEKLKEEKKLYLPLGIVMMFLAATVFVLSYLLYHYEIATHLPTSLIIVHGGYVVVRFVVSFILLLTRRRKKLDNHPLSFIAKHFSYVGVMMSFVLATNAFKLIDFTIPHWNKVVFFRGEFFGVVILGVAISFIVRGTKERIRK